jgi:hypothetical protein
MEEQQGTGDSGQKPYCHFQEHRGAIPMYALKDHGVYKVCYYYKSTNFYNPN